VGSLLRQRRPQEDVLHLRRAGPESIRKTAAGNSLPVDRITEIRVLDPYLYF
jgi:hypothetical protein